MSELERISIREYSRRIGTSDTAVRKAIKAEKIIDGVVYDENGKPYIVPSIANSEWSKSYDPSYERVTKSGGPVRVYQNRNSGQPKEESEEQESVGKHTVDASLASARRAQAVFKAKILELEMKQKQGALVDAKQVYASLFDAGKEIRSALERIPDRVIDSVLAASTRSEAHLILSNEINATLHALQDILRRDITSRK